MPVKCSSLAALLLLSAQGISAYGEKPEATVTLLQLLPKEIQVAASIISAAPAATAYSLACVKKAKRPECQALSGATLIQGPSTIAITLTRMFDLAAASPGAAPPPPGPDAGPDGGPPPPPMLEPIRVAMNCQLDAAGGSVCVQKMSGFDAYPVAAQNAAAISNLEKPVTQTLPAGALKFVPVPVTAGFEKVKGQDTDVTTTSAASATSGAIAGIATASVTSAFNSTMAASTSSVANTTSATTTKASSSTHSATAAATTHANTTSSAAYIVPTGDAGARATNNTGNSTGNSTSGAYSLSEAQSGMTFTGFVMAMLAMAFA